MAKEIGSKVSLNPNRCAFGISGTYEGEFFENVIPEIQPLP